MDKTSIHLITLLKQTVTSVIQEIGAEIGFRQEVPIIVERPGDNLHGDYTTNVALIFYKKIKTEENIQVAEKYSSPYKIAESVTQKLKESLAEYVDKIEVAGPGFINFFLKKEILSAEIARILEEAKIYGSSNWGKGKRWLLEHTSPNPNKAMHLGHLRNNVLGMAIGNLWEFGGVEVIRDTIDNNRGIAIAKLMWGYLKFGRKDNALNPDVYYWYEHQEEWSTPEQLGVRPDRFVDELYVKASEDFADPQVAQQVRHMVIDWEQKETKTWALWEKVLLYSHQGQELTLKRLGSRWDKVWHEHEHYQLGKDMVEQGLVSGIFKKTDDGAVITDLKSFNLPDTVVIKSDGTSLYLTQDLALTKLKKETFKPDKLFWVIGPEQSLALKQMFAVCQQLGIGKLEDFVHIAYGYMSIKGSGKMSSRLGNVVFIDDLLDTAKQAIKEKIDETKFSQAEIDTISEEIGVGAVKYSILKVGRLTEMSFDLETSISLEGNSGPYIQYTYARCCSVLDKAKTEGITLAFSGLPTNPEEEIVMRWLYHFPETVVLAGQNYAPNIICTYIYELCQQFNAFYNQHTIISKKEDENSNTTTMFRLGLTKAVASVLKNSLHLLGMAALSKM